MNTHFLKHYRDYLPECYKRGGRVSNIYNDFMVPEDINCKYISTFTAVNNVSSFRSFSSVYFFRSFSSDSFHCRTRPV